MSYNPVEAAEALQSISQQTLNQYMKSPPPGIPGYQVAAEVARRADMAKRFAALDAQQATDQQGAGTVIDEVMQALNPGSFNPTPANQSALASRPVPSNITGANAPTSPPQMQSLPINSGIASGMQRQPALSPQAMASAQQPMQAAGGTMGRTVYARHGGVPAGEVYGARGSDALEEALKRQKKSGARLYSKERSRSFEGNLKNPYPEQELKRLAMLTSSAREENNIAHGGMGRTAFASNGTQGRTVYAQEGYDPFTKQYAKMPNFPTRAAYEASIDFRRNEVAASEARAQALQQQAEFTRRGGPDFTYPADPRASSGPEMLAAQETRQRMANFGIDPDAPSAISALSKAEQGEVEALKAYRKAQPERGTLAGNPGTFHNEVMATQRAGQQLEAQRADASRIKSLTPEHEALVQAHSRKGVQLVDHDLGGALGENIAREGVPPVQQRLLERDIMANNVSPLMHSVETPKIEDAVRAVDKAREITIGQAISKLRQGQPLSDAEISSLESRNIDIDRLRTEAAKDQTAIGFQTPIRIRDERGGKLGIDYAGRDEAAARLAEEARLEAIVSEGMGEHGAIMVSEMESPYRSVERFPEAAAAMRSFGRPGGSGILDDAAAEAAVTEVADPEAEVAAPEAEAATSDAAVTEAAVTEAAVTGGGDAADKAAVTGGGTDTTPESVTAPKAVDNTKPSIEEVIARQAQIARNRGGDTLSGGGQEGQLGEGFEPLGEVDVVEMREDLTSKLTKESNKNFTALRTQIDKLKEYDPREDIKDIQQRRTDRIKKIEENADVQRLLTASFEFLGSTNFYEGFGKTMEGLAKLNEKEQESILKIQGEMDTAELASRKAYAEYQIKLTDTESAFAAARRADAQGNQRLAESHIQTAVASRAAANSLLADAAANANARLALHIQQQSVFYKKPTEAQTAAREYLENIFVNGSEAERQAVGFAPGATELGQINLSVASPFIAKYLNDVMPRTSSGLGAASFAMSVGRAQTDALEDIRTTWTKNQENLTTRKNTYPLREIEAFTGVSFPLADDGKGGRLNRLKSVRGDETAIAQQNRATLLWEAYQRYLNAGTDVERQAIFARYRELPSLIAAHEDRIKAIVEKQEGGEGDNEFDGNKTPPNPADFVNKP